MTLRAFAALSLALLLSACWGSATPLMPVSAMDAPPIKGKYASVPSDPTKPATWYRAAPAGKQVKLSKRLSKDGEPENWLFDRTLSFDAIEKDVYLVQSLAQDGKTVNYVLFRVRQGGKELLVVTPSCTAAQAKTYEAAGKDNNCTFDRYDRVVQAARTVLAQSASGDPKAVSYATDIYRLVK